MNEYSYQEEHMGTTVSLSLVCESKNLADVIAKDTFKVISDYELKFSRFQLSSELSKLNQSGSQIVSGEFISVLERSLDLVSLTEAAFNPLIQVANLGYKDSFNLIKDVASKASDTKYSLDTKQILIDKETDFVNLGLNQKLDFGGILKGYLSHLLADNIIKNNADVSGCIINIGGDLTTRGFDDLHQPFIFYLYNPITEEETPVEIINRSLATSGTYFRKWLTNNGIQHHIVDPQSKHNPKTDLVLVSIITNDGALSEAICKLFLTRGITTALDIVPPKTNNYLYFAVSANGDTQTNII